MASAERRAVTVRTTAGPRIGLGHLRRTLTLASAIVARRVPCRFLVDGDEASLALVRRHELPVTRVDGGAEATVAALDGGALVIDDYALDETDLRALRRQVPCTLVLDDTAERAVDARLLLNAAPSAGTLPYRTSSDCERLLGAGYALLRALFAGIAPRSVAPAVARVLVTFGGADPTRETEPAIAAVRAALPESAIDVVVGPHFGRTPAAPAGVTLHVAPDDLSALMRTANLAVSAGGQTTYELAALGVPTVALCTADNQRINLAALAAVPTLVLTDRSALAEAVRALAADGPQRALLAERGRRLFDGRGADRVAARLIEALDG